jgi:hypothetical protein
VKVAHVYFAPEASSRAILGPGTCDELGVHVRTLRDAARTGRGMTVAFALFVFIEFAPTYFLRTPFRPAPPWLVHLHGAPFSAWILLLLVQTTLVAVKRTDLHRWPGVAGGVLAGSMIRQSAGADRALPFRAGD